MRLKLLRHLASLVLVTTVVLGLSSCSHTPPGPAPEVSESSKAAQMNQEVADCLDAWLNTQAPQDAIDAGLAPAHDVTGESVPSPVTVDANGVYRVNMTSPVFNDWCAVNNVPWSDVRGYVLNGVSCPYTEPSTGNQ